VRVVALLLLVLAGSRARAEKATATEEDAWHQVDTPKDGPAQSIGGYSAGCVQGATRLPLNGRGFHVARPERRRVFGHPLLIEFIRALGKSLIKTRAGTLWVGDLGQARGGPAPTGHASHQTGLDVDLWFGKRGRGARTRPIELVDLTRMKLTRGYSRRVARLIAAAAASPVVDRIFVNPVIKRALCDKVKGSRAWLHKVRPWYGHHDHFHVRLACPADSPDCEAQPPLPPGDGCDQLDWWLKPQAAADRDKARQKYQARVGASPQLPPKCRDVLVSK
jgi:penicillin-insensitive murein endopeptidase